ncbi:Hypothetical predicted protein [Mytilus galloprovincialis]|uniref:DUF6589 domain-containing protein n=1 Tax=Mytilus galloprovincialis TaxID=29158 RepID=A0A8B6CIZ2_MYTGA|nr:Hypothetical predicted protein [Mytilus galloprovincialis]
MSCANCNKVFIEKPNNSGYYRYSLENSLPCGDESARNILVNITGSQLTPVPNKRQGQFLCPECWSKLNDTAKYQKAVTEFWKRTDNDTYIAQKEVWLKVKYVNLKPKIGTVAALILHSKAPRKASFLPTLFSIQFWRGGLKRKLIKQLAHTGICKGYDTTLAAVDNISSDFDSAAVVCKEKIEGQFRNAPIAELRQHEAANPDLRIAMAATMQNIEDEIVEPSSSTENTKNDNLDDNLDDTIPYGLGESDSDDGGDHEILEESSDDSNVIPSDEDLSLSDEDIAEIESGPEEVEQEIAHLGFTMCWDNVGKKVTTRNPSEDKKNVYLNMALGYIGVNRVQTTHLDWKVNGELKKAVNLSPGIFVPNAKDTENLENRMKVIVSRIITRHLRWFNRHLDPSSTQGAITIYENLQRYIPSIREKPYTSIVFGDGLSCERGNDAHRARCNGLNPWERLEGCEPAVQEFHKEMLLLQDYYDEFFKGSSAADRGTLSHLKNIFNYRQVKSDISDNFNHAWELMCLATEGYVCLLAMNLLDMKSANDRPNSAPEQIENSSNDDRAQYLHSVSTAIVKELWHHFDHDPLQFDDNSEPDRYCCGEETGEDVILCGAGRNCSHGELFHYTCVGLDPDDLPNNWFCSDASDSLPEGDWFCKAACKKAKKGKPKRKSKSASKTENSPNSDFKCNYSRAIAWVGLNLLCRRDAVREADGEAMLTHWKFDLIHFFSTKHPKYLILAHRLLVSVNGWLPEKLKNDLIYNRTVNYGGGMGRNLPQDFMNEILNRLFKDILDAAKGRYTKTTIQRCGQIVGPLGEALDSVFDSQIIEKELYRHRRRESNRDKNVERMITFLQGDDLFSTINGRHHRAFDPFVHNENPKFPGKFQPKMKQLSKRLDKRRRVIVDA